MPDIEAPWLDPDRYVPKALCKCSICQEPLHAGAKVVFTDAGTVCVDCIMEMDWRLFLYISGLTVDTLTADNAPTL